MFRYPLAALLLAGLLAAGCASDKPRDIKPDGDKKGKADAGKDRDRDKAKTDNDKVKPKDDNKPADGTPKPRKDVEQLGPPNVEKDDPNVKQTSDAGVIRGRVLWDGPLPPAPAGGGQFVTVNGRRVDLSPTPPVRIDPATKGVADVMVWVDKVPPSLKTPPRGEAALTQSRGVYRPRAQFAAEGARLRLRTTDDEADFQGAGMLRFSRSLKRGEERQVTLPREGLVTVRSDARPGATPAYVRVVSHSHHAVTGNDGRFELPPLPPGEYDVLLWPAGATRGGKNILQRVAVSLDDGRGAMIDWTLARRD